MVNIPPMVVSPYGPFPPSMGMLLGGMGMDICPISAIPVFDYLLREMAAPEGGFYSATDADSEGVEGRYFVWSEREIRERLGPEADRFAAFYGVTPGGDFE